MAVRVEWTVHKLPDSYVTKATLYKYIPDENGAPDKHGRLPRIRVTEEVEYHGGYLVKMMRGHSLRFIDKAHLLAAGFTEKPRLIDDQTGLECDERGIPLDIAAIISGSPMQDGASDEELAPLGNESSGSVEVDAAIADTE